MAQKLVGIKSVFHVMLFATTTDHQKRRAVAAIGFELGLAAPLHAHVAFGEGKAVLRKPAFGGMAIWAFGGAVHDHFFGFDAGGKLLDLRCTQIRRGNAVTGAVRPAVVGGNGEEKGEENGFHRFYPCRSGR